MNSKVSRLFSIALLMSLFLHGLFLIYSPLTENQEEQKFYSLKSSSHEEEGTVIFKVTITKPKVEPVKREKEVGKLVEKSVTQKDRPLSKKRLRKKAVNEDDNLKKELATKSISSLSQGEIKEKVDQYLQELQRYLDKKKFYPRQARRLRHHGTVVVSLKINLDGSFSNIVVSRESSSPFLNEAALKLVEGVKKFKPLPKSLEKVALFKLPISYVIN